MSWGMGLTIEFCWFRGIDARCMGKKALHFVHLTCGAGCLCVHICVCMCIDTQQYISIQGVPNLGHYYNFSEHWRTGSKPHMFITSELGWSFLVIRFLNTKNKMVSSWAKFNRLDIKVLKSVSDSHSLFSSKNSQ